MNQNFKKILVLMVVLFAFLGFNFIRASLYVEDKLRFQRSGDDMISLTRGSYTYTIAVGTDDSFVIKNGSSTVIFKIDSSGNIYFPAGIIQEGNISLSNVTDFPTDCATGTFIYGIDSLDGSLKCRDL